MCSPSLDPGLLHLLANNTFPNLVWLDLAVLSDDHCLSVLKLCQNFPVVQDLRVPGPVYRTAEQQAIFENLCKCCSKLERVFFNFRRLEDIDLSDPYAFERLTTLPLSSIWFGSRRIWEVAVAADARLGLQISVPSLELFEACYLSMPGKISALRFCVAVCGKLPDWAVPLVFAAAAVRDAGEGYVRDLFEICCGVSASLSEESPDDAKWRNFLGRLLQDHPVSDLIDLTSALKSISVTFQRRGYQWLKSSGLPDLLARSPSLFSNFGNLQWELRGAIMASPSLLDHPDFQDRTRIAELTDLLTAYLFLDCVCSLQMSEIKEAVLVDMLDCLSKLAARFSETRLVVPNFHRMASFVLANPKRAEQFGTIVENGYLQLLCPDMPALCATGIDISNFKMFVSASMQRFHGLEWGPREESRLLDGLWFDALLIPPRSAPAIDSAVAENWVLSYCRIVPDDVVSFLNLQSKNYLAKFPRVISALRESR